MAQVLKVGKTFALHSSKYGAEASKQKKREEKAESVSRRIANHRGGVSSNANKGTSKQLCQW
jgi:hypothetical protein